MCVVNSFPISSNLAVCVYQTGDMPLTDTSFFVAVGLAGLVAAISFVASAKKGTRQRSNSFMTNAMVQGAFPSHCQGESKTTRQNYCLIHRAKDAHIDVIRLLCLYQRSSSIMIVFGRSSGHDCSIIDSYLLCFDCSSKQLANLSSPVCCTWKIYPPSRLYRQDCYECVNMIGSHRYLSASQVVPLYGVSAKTLTFDATFGLCK